MNIAGFAQSPNSTIRLVGGITPHSGRLEVFVDGRWGTVCALTLGFTKAEADVACKQLQLGPSESQGNYILFRYANLN